MIDQLNERSREIFRLIVDNYVSTGEPIGSRTISRRLGMNLSPASIRNVMADLEELGLLFAPHTSAGRLPTEAGLRLFVDGLLEVGDLSSEERESINGRCAASGRGFEEVLTEATSMLSGLSRCAGMVVAPKTDAPLKHIEFVNLSPDRALVVIVTGDGMVENRVIELPPGIPHSALVDAGNYLNARLAGRTLAEARVEILAELEADSAALDELSSRVVEAGLATWSGGETDAMLIVRGQANLLEDVSAVEDLERIRAMMGTLETKRELIRLLDLAEGGEGVQIFIGAENKLFGMTGCSVIVAPFTNRREQIVGAVGVIGPTRLNYARIIPMVDYTSKVIGRLIG
jgi:heat-inducible transcriptional repressor